MVFCSYLVAVRQEATLLNVADEAPDRNVVQDELKVVELLDGFTELVHLKQKHKRVLKNFKKLLFSC